MYHQQCFDIRFHSHCGSAHRRSRVIRNAVVVRLEASHGAITCRLAYSFAKPRIDTIRTCANQNRENQSSAPSDWSSDPDKHDSWLPKEKNCPDEKKTQAYHDHLQGTNHSTKKGSNSPGGNIVPKTSQDSNGKASGNAGEKSSSMEASKKIKMLEVLKMMIMKMTRVMTRAILGVMPAVKRISLAPGASPKRHIFSREMGILVLNIAVVLTAAGLTIILRGVGFNELNTITAKRSHGPESVSLYDMIRVTNATTSADGKGQYVVKVRRKMKKAKTKETPADVKRDIIVIPEADPEAVPEADPDTPNARSLYGNKSYKKEKAKDSVSNSSKPSVHGKDAESSPRQVDQVHEAMIRNLKNLKVMEKSVSAEHLVTRRQFSRWLYRAWMHDQLVVKPQSCRLITYPAVLEHALFLDVPPNDMDYLEIQSLADAGIIPLDSKTDGPRKPLLFQPDSLLERQELIAWKTRLNDMIRREKPSDGPGKGDLPESDLIDIGEVRPEYVKYILEELNKGYNGSMLNTFGVTSRLWPHRCVFAGEAATVLSIWN